MLEVNAIGVFLGIRAVLPGMREREWGRIVAIASSASHQGVRYGAGYVMSKHAVLGLIRSVAVEVAGTPITANCVCPAVVESEMTDRSLARIVRTGRTLEEARAEMAGSLTALGRFVRPEEVAGIVAYLVGEQAAAVNGQSLIMDGGRIQQ
jgi:NAD(P)-dependent dehydrogenase (short-subunit alcohol dehydrogenase family)